jgi:hypothetical protein
MEMAGHKALPVLLCGRREKVGSLVIEELKPEYEGMPRAIFRGCSYVLTV